MDKNYKGSVIVVADDTIGSNIPFTTRKEAEEIFLKLYKSYLTNFRIPTKEDIDIFCNVEDVDFYFEKGFIAVRWF